MFKFINIILTSLVVVLFAGFFRPITVQAVSWIIGGDSTTGGVSFRERVTAGTPTPPPKFIMDTNGAITSDLGGYGGFSGAVTNQVKYSSAEGATGDWWTGGTGTTHTIDSTTAANGSKSFKAALGVSGSSNFGPNVASLSIDTSYTLSFWMKASTTLTSGVGWSIKNSGDTATYCAGDSDFTPYRNITTAWQKFVFICSSGASGTDVAIVKFTNSNLNTNLWVDAVQIEIRQQQGQSTNYNVATQFIPTGNGAVTKAAGFTVSQDLTAYNNAYLAAYGGNVGIGTTSPAGKLDINGSLCIAGDCKTAWSQISNAGGWTDGGASVYLTTSTDKVGIGTTTPGQELDVTGDITLSGNVIGDITDSLRLQAGGSTSGNGNNGSIYFLASSGTTTGRVDTAKLASSGDGTDGAVTITGASKNIMTDDLGADSDDNGAGNADGIATAITPTVASGATAITVSSTTGFVAADDVLLIQMTGTGAGNYEVATISTVDSSTQVTVAPATTNAYTNDGSSKPQMVRIPQYTNVTITSGSTLTATAWDGTTGGVIYIKANGTVNLTSTGTNLIDANGLGFAGGAGGGAKTGGATVTCVNGNGLPGNNGTAGSAGSAGTGPTAALPGGSGGGVGGLGVKGGHDGAANIAGGAGGGGSAGGGSGGVHAAASSAATAGAAGGAGGTVQGGAAGAAGTAAGAVSTTYGDTNFTQIFLGSGGGGGASGGSGGSGACRANNPATVTGGVGGNSGAGATGAKGGGIVVIATDTLTNNGTIRANGADGSAGSNGSNGGDGAGDDPKAAGGGGGGGNGGASGGGAGGSVWFRVGTSSGNAGTAAAGAAGGGTATGGNGGSCSLGGQTDGGGGGAGKSGTVVSTNCTTAGSAGASTNSGAGSAGSAGRTKTSTIINYGTLYIGATNTTAADLAEYYVSGDKSIAEGDVVSISDTKVLDDNSNEVTNKGVLRKADTPYDPKLLGIISTNPGLIMGSIDEDTQAKDKRMLSLAGRVPVKIDLDSPAIAIGEYLTSSTKPGLAMKATRPGYVVARALEAWTKDLGSDRIEAFVNLSYYMGELDEKGNLQQSTVNILTVNDRIIGTDKMRGNETLKSGEKAIRVAQNWDLVPVSILGTASYDTNVFVTGISKYGFFLNVGLPPAKDEKLFWQAMW